MRKKSIVIFSVFILILIAAVTYFNFAKNKTRETNNLQPKNITGQSKIMKITSLAFENNASIPQKYTCDGKNVNPDLEIADVPSSAKSLTLIVHDPDAPLEGGFTHWVVFNIPPETQIISENSAPGNSIQGTIGTGKAAYAGPCPPTGTHHYHFKLYALDTNLNLDSAAKKEDVEKAMEGHIVDQAELVGLYKRN